MRKFFFVIVLIFLVKPLWAMELAGVAIEEKIVNDEGTTLVLNGAGIRKKLFFKIYIAELYLEKRQEVAKDAIADEGSKRVVMHFLYEKVGKDKIVEGWNDGFVNNNESEMLNALQSRIDLFNKMFQEDMVEGDKVFFDYIPGKGTSVNIKGSIKGTIVGKDFNDALLSIWLGGNPVSSDLRQDLLQP